MSVQRKWKAVALVGLVWAATAAQGATAQDKPLLTPPPRSIEWTGASLPLIPPVPIAAVTPEETQVARVLAAEMRRLHGVTLRPAPVARARIELALTSSARGKALLAGNKLADSFNQAPGDEAYLLDVNGQRAALVARTPRGLLYAAQTLLQLVRDGKAGNSAQVEGARVVDYPQLGFRGVHICIFPNTELEGVRQAILVAARYKYNAIVIEPWASLRSASHPETAYENTYTPAQLKPLIDLGKALHMEMIPMLNSWGHASGMRSRSSQHVVLDRFPQFKPLYEEDGWSFCLTNPAIYGQLFDRYAELIELFGNPKYFHIGLDEAWGHRGLMTSDKCRGADPRATLEGHLKKLYGYFAEHHIRVIAWHDMFIQRDHPQLGRLSPAGSVPPLNSHLVLDDLPKDVIMDAWNYDETREWPVTKYFQDRGFLVLVSPWKSRKNTVSLLNTAKRLNAMGLLQTTWDSLDVTLPSVGEAGILAWTAPGFDLDTIPFEDYVRSVRVLPIVNLPKLEKTLSAAEASAPAKRGTK
jgi:hypothetical protein